MATIQGLKELAATIKNETQAGANTADRIGGAVADAAELIETAQGTAEYAAMNLTLEYGADYSDQTMPVPIDIGNPASIENVKVASGSFVLNLGANFQCMRIMFYKGGTLVNYTEQWQPAVEQPFTVDNTQVDRINITVYGATADTVVTLHATKLVINSTLFANTRS